MIKPCCELCSVDDTLDYIFMRKNDGKVPTLLGFPGVILLTGAGVSVSAGIPLWNPLKEILYRDLFPNIEPKEVITLITDKMKELKLKSDSDKLQEIKRLLYFEEENTQQDMEYVAEFINIVTDENDGWLPPETVTSILINNYGMAEAGRLLSYFLGKPHLPTPFYSSMVKLFSEGFMNFYFTFNLDTAFENMFYRAGYGKVLRVFDDPNKIPFNFLEKSNNADETLLEVAAEDLVNGMFVFHLHGIIDNPHTLRVSIKELVKEDMYSEGGLNLLLDIVKKTRALFISGYSGADRIFRGFFNKLVSEVDDLLVIWIDVAINDTQRKIVRDAIEAAKEEKNNTCKGVRVIFVKASADEFFPALLSRLEREKKECILSLSKGKLWKTLSELNKEDFVKSVISKYSVMNKIEAYGSVILAGDYGVYYNGKMIQLVHPLFIRGYALYNSRESENDELINFFQYDPRNGSFVHVKNEVKEKAEKIFSFISEIVESLKEKNYEKFQRVIIEKFILEFWKKNKPLIGRLFSQISDKEEIKIEHLKKVFKEVCNKIKKETYCSFENGEVNWEEVVKSCIDELQNNLKTLFCGLIKKINEKKLCKISKYFIISEFPIGQGFGDSDIPLLTILFWNALTGDNNTYSKLWRYADDNLVRLSSLVVSLFSYGRTSYLRPLSTFWNIDNSWIVMFDRSKWQSYFIKKFQINHMADTRCIDECSKALFRNKIFPLMNLLISFYTPDILKNGEPLLSKNFPNRDLNFVLAYSPRRVDLESFIGGSVGAFTTGSAVDTADNFAVPYANMALVTSQMKELLSSSKIDYHLLGRMFTNYHYYLVGIKRGTLLVNTLVNELGKLNYVYGSKTSGSGPGGALVIAYNPSICDINELVSVIANHNHDVLLWKF